MDQLERISQMEAIMQRADTVLTLLSTALDDYSSVLKDFEVLKAYYGSKEWFEDLDSDQAGLLPQDLHRGVLSEDGIYNLQEKEQELLEIMRSFSAGRE